MARKDEQDTSDKKNHTVLYIIIVIIALIVIAAIIGIIIYATRKPEPPSPPGPPGPPKPPSGVSQVYILGPGPTATGGVDPIQSVFYSDSPFTTGNPNIDPNLAKILTSLRSGVDPKTDVATIDQVKSNIGTLPVIAGFYKNAPVDSTNQVTWVVIVNSPSPGDSVSSSPLGYFGTKNSFVFMYGIPPSTDWVQKNLLPTGYTVNINSKTVMPLS